MPTVGAGDVVGVAVAEEAVGADMGVGRQIKRNGKVRMRDGQFVPMRASQHHHARIAHAGERGEKGKPLVVVNERWGI